jgi:hypothetical protein
MNQDTATRLTEANTPADFEAALLELVRPHLNDDEEYDRVRDRDGAGAVLDAVESATGHVTVTLARWDEDTRSVVVEMRQSDAEGDLPIRAGLWLGLGHVDAQTRLRRAVRYFALEH